MNKDSFVKFLRQTHGCGLIAMVLFLVPVLIPASWEHAPCSLPWNPITIGEAVCMGLAFILLAYVGYALNKAAKMVAGETPESLRDELFRAAGKPNPYKKG